MNPNPPDFIIGDKRNRQYLDAAGRPLKVGDIVSHVSRSGSSVDLNFRLIKEIIDTDAPAHVGYRERTRIESWDTAYKLKVVLLAQDPLDRSRFFPVPDSYSTKRVSLDAASTSTITAVERVLKVEGVGLDV